MSITLITPTHARPRAFALLEKYVQRQTYRGDVQWIVVCDSGIEDYQFTMNQVVIARDTSQDTPEHRSIARNYLEAIPHIKHDKIIIGEDDDWYRDTYLQAMSEALDKAPLAGAAPALYFNVTSRRWRVLANTAHASLAATAFTQDVLPVFEHAWRIKHMLYADLWLWAHWPKTLQRPSILLANDQGRPLQVGLKGLPHGAKGLGLGHDPTQGTRDPACHKLRQWVGADYLNYYTSDFGLRR